MKLSTCFIPPLSLTAVVGLAMAAHAAASLTVPSSTPASTAIAPTISAAKPPAAAPVAATNPATNVITIPISTFLMPRSPQEGRDPFFPTSMRPYATATVVASTNFLGPMVAVDLRLKGFSGPPERRLAIINNHTFEAGEEADVMSGNNKV